MDLVEEGELDTGDCFHRGNVCWSLLEFNVFGGPEASQASAPQGLKKLI
jgi:hypothetical protein